MRSLIPRHAITLWCVPSLLLGVSTVAAQGFHLSSADVADSAALATSMPRLAAQVLGTYRDADRLRLLDNLFRLQILTGRYSEAWASLAELRTLRRETTPPARAQYVPYGVFLRARTLAASTGRPFPDTFTDAFRETFGRLDDPTAALAARAILVPPRTVANDLRWATPNLAGRTTVSLEEALQLLHVYQAVESYRAFAGLPAALVAEDEARVKSRVLCKS